MLPPPTSQWHLYGPEDRAVVYGAAGVNAVGAWRTLGHRGCSDVVIGLVDDSCWLGAPGLPPEAFAGAAVVGEANLETASDPADLGHALAPPGCTHGTSMATLMVGRGPDTFGVAPGVRLLPVVVHSSRSRLSLPEQSLIEVLDHMDAHVDIAVLPFGRSPSLLYSQAVLDRLHAWGTGGGRTGHGVLVVAAAGNANCPLDHSGPHAAVYRADPSTGTVASSRTFRNALTRVPSVLHVAAVTSRSRRALYSGYGRGVDLCAPSSDGWPFATGTTTIGLTTAYGPPARVTHAFKGTSGAAALVAGVAALARSALPHVSALELGRLLCATAERGLDCSAGLPDDAPPWLQPPIPPFSDGAFDADGWSPWFGYGRVDADAAVRSALGGR